nr:reverse transcriptase domain-containing protein [Tanacetum cinerariifolium]
MADRTMKELLQAPTEGVNTNSRESSSKTDDRIDKLVEQISNLVQIVNKQVITLATVKAVEKSCVICGGTLSSNTIPNPKGEMKVITTRSGLSYEGPSIPTNSSPEKVVEQETEETTDKEQPNCQGSTAHIQPLVVPTPITKPDVPKTQPKPNIPYPSNLHFDISIANALLLMQKFASTIKSLLENKDKLLELAKVPLNENYSAMLLKKLLKKLGDPGKFLIPCDFPRMDVSLILGRSLLRTGRALIGVYGEEITLRVNDESVTFNLNQTMIYSSTYDDNLVNRIDVIEITCEEYAQDVLDFKYNSKSGNPTLVSNPLLSKETKSDFCKEPIVKSSSPTLTPFGESDFLLEEIKDCYMDQNHTFRGVLVDQNTIYKSW